MKKERDGFISQSAITHRRTARCAPPRPLNPRKVGSAEDVMRCRLCGTPVRVVSSGEGTSSYQPVSTEYAKLFAAEARLARLERIEEAARQYRAARRDWVVTYAGELVGYIEHEKAGMKLDAALAVTEEGAEE